MVAWCVGAVCLLLLSFANGDPTCDARQTQQPICHSAIATEITDGTCSPETAEDIDMSLVQLRQSAPPFHWPAEGGKQGENDDGVEQKVRHLFVRPEGEDDDKDKKEPKPFSSWNATVHAFTADFDSNLPERMQKAMDDNTEWAHSWDGLKLALTKDHYYLCYHYNVGLRMSEYIPTGYFNWTFGNDYVLLDQVSDDEVKVGRNGTMNLNLGRWKLNVFWNLGLKKLSNQETFFQQFNDKYDDCHGCDARMLFVLKRGGLKGEGDDWKIVDFILQKLT